MNTVPRYAVGPRFKGLAGFDNAELAIIYDSIPLQSDASALSGSTFQFFPSVAQNDNTRANYIRNPLPKNRPYDITGICVAFDFNTLTVVPGDQGTLDLKAFYNTLTDAELTLTTSEQDQLIGKHIQELCLFNEAGVYIHGSDDGGTGDGFTRILHFPRTKVLRFEDPLHLESQEVFEVDIELQDTSGLIPAADWSTLSRGTPHVYVFMQVVYRESSMQGG